MEKIVNLIKEDWYNFVAFSPRLLIAVIVLVTSYFIGKYFAKVVTAIMRKTSIREVHESFFRIVLITIVSFLGLIISLNILGLEKLAVSVLAGGGVTAIVLGFAFREIGENFLAGIFLSFSRPFKTGDAIKTEDIEGRVQDIELRYTHLRTDDGRDIYVPSSQLFNKPVTNFTKDGLRRISFTVGIDYSNDSKAACTLLKNTVEAVKGVLNDPIPGAYILGISPEYVEIQVFFWVDVFDKAVSILDVRTEVMDHCRKALLSEEYIVNSETTANITLVNGSTKT